MQQTQQGFVLPSVWNISTSPHLSVEHTHRQTRTPAIPVWGRRCLPLSVHVTPFPRPRSRREAASKWQSEETPVPPSSSLGAHALRRDSAEAPGREGTTLGVARLSLESHTLFPEEEEAEMRSLQVEENEARRRRSRVESVGEEQVGDKEESGGLSAAATQLPSGQEEEGGHGGGRGGENGHGSRLFGKRMEESARLKRGRSRVKGAVSLLRALVRTWRFLYGWSRTLSGSSDPGSCAL
jgi:hypothetical protein